MWCGGGRSSVVRGRSRSLGFWFAESCGPFCAFACQCSVSRDRMGMGMSLGTYEDFAQALQTIQIVVAHTAFERNELDIFH